MATPKSKETKSLPASRKIGKERKVPGADSYFSGIGDYLFGPLTNKALRSASRMDIRAANNHLWRKFHKKYKKDLAILTNSLILVIINQ